MITKSYSSIFKDPNAPIVIMMPGFQTFCKSLKSNGKKSDKNLEEEHKLKENQYLIL